MQKVYLLLRDNQQNGPFNLDELLRYDLKPHDLIWIEGKSAGWYYPQEIEALRPHLPFLKKATSPVEATAQTAFSKPETTSPKKIFVSMPAANAVKETTDQTIPKPLPTVEEKTPPPAKPFQPEATELKTTYAKSLNEIELDYTARADQKKRKKKPLFSKSGVIVLCLLSVALFATWKLANKPATEIADAPVQQTVSNAQPLSVKPEASEPVKEPSAQKATGTFVKKQKGIKSITAGKNATVVESKPAKFSPANVAATKPTNNDEAYQPAPVVKEETKPVVEEKTTTASTEAPKEKKKLRDKIFDIFKKKPEERPEEAKPAETENGGRQATRREAGSSLAQLVTVKFDIPNSWMMGIKGAKATLTNRSSETLAKAVVEVSYYNDDNDLLDKKTIVFSNIKSKQIGTVSVPEHSTATRLEYSVVSAVGNEPVAFLR